MPSKKVGVSVNTFNRWERGLQLPQLETLDLLCKAFGLPPEELGFGNIIAAKRRTTEDAISIRNENTFIKQEVPQKEGTAGR